jgi:hypothetical protein
MDIKYLNIGTLRSTCAVPNMAVFFSSLISFMLFAYLLKDLELIPFASIIIPTIFVLTSYLIYIYIVRSSYAKFISAYFFNTFLPDKIAVY